MAPQEWKSTVTDTGITPSTKSPYHHLIPNESAMIHVTRTGGTGAIIVQVWASIDDGTTESAQPVWTFIMDAADDDRSFPVSGALVSIAIGVVGTAAVLTAIFALNTGLTPA